MQFISLSAQYRHIKDDIEKEISKTLSAQNFTAGHQVAELEKQLADYVGVPHCVFCSDGTDALFVCLSAYGVSKGDAVVLPAFAPTSVARAVVMCKATPIFADIDKKTYTINPKSIEALFATTQNIKAVVAVDTFGVIADYDAICTIAKSQDARVIECAFESFGSTKNGKKSCSFGDAAVTCFAPERPLGCYSNGGAIFSNDSDFAKSCKKTALEIESRFSPLEAAVLTAKLKSLDFELETRNLAADCYGMHLKGVVTLPFIPESVVSAFSQYTVLCESSEQRERLVSGLREKYVPTRVCYKEPVYFNDEFSAFAKRGDCPVAEMCCERTLSIPMHPYLNDRMIKTICDAMKGSL